MIFDTTASTSYSCFRPMLVGHAVCGRDVVLRQSRRSAAIVDHHCGVVVVLAVWSGIEAVTNVNIANYVGARPGGLATIEATRWGLNRAEGPTHHPIFLGGILVLLLPWTVQVARESLGKGRANWGGCCPTRELGGALFTASRGPWLGPGRGGLFLVGITIDWVKPHLAAWIYCGGDPICHAQLEHYL